MKTIYLHIGTHKTGTTSLQFFLNRATESLRRQGVLYPAAGRSARIPYAHHLLAWSVQQSRGVQSERAWDELNRELRAWPGEKVVISSEDFCLSDESQIQKIGSYFSEYRLEVIVYLRQPFDFLVSAYKQHLLSKGRRPIEDFINTVAWRCDYFSLVSRWQKAAQAVHIHIYDKVKTASGLESDFAARIGINFDKLEPFVMTPVNVSPSYKSLQVVRVLNTAEYYLAMIPGAARLVAGVAKRARRSIYDRLSIGRMLVGVMTPLFRSGTVRDVARQQAWINARSAIYENHQELLIRHIDDEDHIYLRFSNYNGMTISHL